LLLPPKADVIQELDELVGGREVINPFIAGLLYFRVNQEFLDEIFYTSHRIFRS
jgi:hypothetical protein